MSKCYKVFLFSFFFSLILGGFTPCRAEQDDGPRLAPLNPAFVNHIKSIKKGRLNDRYISFGGGRLIAPTTPPPQGLDHVKGILDENVDNTVYPTTYDLRDEDRVTLLIKNQEGYSCWFHATYVSLESWLLPNEHRNFDAETPNWFEYHGFTLPLGGDHRMAAAIMIRWDAPFEDPDEADYTYWRVQKPEAIQKHIQQVILLPKRAKPHDNKTTKWYIMNHGAVYAAIRFDSPYYEYDNFSYYYYGEEPFNHGIALVGWDDNYSRHNFIHPPPGDGAFIGRNSWGDYFGDGGCFYISYYDKSLHPRAVFNNAEPVDNYGHNYQYDPYGAVISTGYNDPTCWGGNVFTAVNDQPIEAVGFYTNDRNTNYQVYIYKNPGPGSPVQGAPMSVKTGSFIYPGYYTVKLDNPVPVKKGDRFSVVIRYGNTGYNFPVPIEYPIDTYSGNATANAGESFISRDGQTWEDLTRRHADTNICIKAFSRYTPPPRPILSMQLTQKVKRLWLVNKPYSEISMRMDNPQQVHVQRIELYRKSSVETVHRPVHTFFPSDLQNGESSFIDDKLLVDGLYLYHITAFDADNNILARSRQHSFVLQTVGGE